MALSCIPKSVISGASCVENPAGLGNYLFAVPLENIASIAANDEKNQYDITPPRSRTLLLSTTLLPAHHSATSMYWPN